MEESSRKRSLDEIEEIKNSFDSNTPSLAKNKRVRQFSEIWDYFIKGAEKSHSHYEATYYYCFSKKSWARGKLAKLEAHLSNECPNCPKNISRYWQEKVAKRKSNYIRQKKNSTPVSQALITSHFSPDRPLSKVTINRLDQKITKAWIMAEIPFDVIENPFIIDMFKEILSAYNPPSRGTLSGRLLDEEVAQINCAINKEIDKADHLTLALDGWTLSTMESNYNYIVTTNTQKEYLIVLKDYSSNSHTDEFLINEISNIVEKLGSDKFAAIVTDMVSNCNLACQKIQQMYPYIWNIRCAAHVVNLIASDLKNQSFFNSSHLSYSLLVKGFTDIKINSSSLKVWLLLEHKESIINQEIANLIANEDFFTMSALIAIEIWQSLGHTRSESNELVALMRRFESKLPPFDLPYVSGTDIPKIWIFSINPTQANCEQNFSMLKWILGDRQTSLDINKLEGMSKIKSYYTANIRRKLNFFGKELTESDL
ncbi:35297_t:CDS:2 [Gigaspora margarita]|uniref:35297_t:CDS:1 n=1 Tax=Gigaspora margarita TaxID=4874 RepID=A0ABN7WAA1_GIGMA|nr:35297_t:CDS:2 [Gigaspora margarita]